MPPVPPVRWVFFPLDEKLALSPGSLVPSQEEHLVHLATWMPFACAGQMLHQLTGVFVSEATIRRHTEQAGKYCEEVQNPKNQQTPPQTSVPEQVVMSADGAFVPLVGGVWAEVRTMAIGEVKQTGDQVHTTNLSYFSRMTDAATFTELAEGELQRRQVREAEQVAAVMDGAPWLQEVVDLSRPDAVRILDFPHAAQRISALLETVQQAGHALPVDALSRCLHVLKHRGPAPVLRWLRHLTRSLLEVGNIREDLAYLQKREALMQYPRYRDAGWPIGSGMVESANKLVMQARLKGPGMHWAAPHVNPMLALRNAVCNDRWSEAWEQTSSARLNQLRHARISQAQKRQQEATQRFVLAWARFLLPRSVARPPQPQLPPQPARMVAGRPTTHHPWRRPWAPRSSTVASAKN
jgi:Uncharacterised protein family (UPF0236)